jgi:hypothetical protein
LARSAIMFLTGRREFTTVIDHGQGFFELDILESLELEGIGRSQPI